ncbi:adenylate cyclase [Enhydrobacter aerosaccus]|uniref:Adenylate cyclase n=1 Tax=Enhydrobacter aerosaccus TaxID=225324 RepID=A0A1T4TFM3_9HYPH|nr:adenylate/guanylate cyclase domain-containing protein [Enhydrobacter aerosaccus]SKA39234.1 adenylate cyclase [Enhydrobacter aerosaccus]
MANTVSGTYSQALRQEILRSEQRRMRALAIILAVLLAVTATGALFFPALRQRLFSNDISVWAPIAGFGPFILFELGALRVMRWRIAADKDFPRIGRFANALVETSLPGVVIFVLSRHMEPQLVFGFWPPLLYFVFIILSTLRLDFWLSLWTGAVAAIEQLALVYWLLPLDADGTGADATIYYHLSRSMMLLLAGIVAGIVAQSLRRQFEDSVTAAAARDRVTNLFGQHVSPAVVDRLLASHTDPPSEIRPVCVLFLDIRGFTAMSRTRPAAETVALLNDFFADMVAIVDRHGGIVNKFLGDGFLAVFGAPLPDPDAAAHAVAAGREMLKALDAWNRRRPMQALQVGIGIHSGDAVTGTVGSAERKEYTVIGDTVNLAARLEQLTKDTGARLLVSDALVTQARQADAADLGPMAIRGYSAPVRVWRIA